MVRILFLILLSGALSSQLFGKPEAPWEKISDHDKIIVYMREPGPDGTISVRGEGLIDASPAQVFTVLEDNKLSPAWMPLVLERRTLQIIDAQSRIEYTHIGLPWPLQDRYFIDESRLEKLADGTYVVSIKSVANPQKSWLAEDKVLGLLHFSQIKLVPRDGGRKTQLSIEVKTDPRGQIPLWMVNLQQRSWPRKFMEGLSEQLSLQGKLAPTPKETVAH